MWLLKVVEWDKDAAEDQNMVSVMDMCCQEIGPVVQMKNEAVSSLGHVILAECLIGVYMWTCGGMGNPPVTTCGAYCS